MDIQKIEPKKYKAIKDFIQDIIKNDLDKSVSICLHDAPDPDAMGSALGFQFLLKQFDINSSIYYRGEISHPQNKTIVNVLDIVLLKTENDIEGRNVCIDCTEKNSPAKTADLVIDHHRNTSDAKFQVISPNYGSCATIVWEILKEFKITPTTEEVNISTALLLGIRTDTNDLISENMIREDFVAYQELLDYADKESLQKVMSYPLPRYLYDKRSNLHKDGNSYESNGTFVGGIGFIPGDQRDAIAILAEEYARMESVNTAVIFAITDRKTLQISVRSSLTSLDVGSMCSDLFGLFGGGKAYKGGASIPLNFYSNLENGEKDQFWKITCKHMFRQILKESWVDNTLKE